MDKVYSVFNWTVHVVWEYSGAALICAKISPGRREENHSSFVFWFLSVYLTVYGLSIQSYENKFKEISQKKQNILTFEKDLSDTQKINLLKEMYNHKVPDKPSIFSPESIYKSLFYADLKKWADRDEFIKRYVHRKWLYNSFEKSKGLVFRENNYHDYNCRSDSVSSLSIEKSRIDRFSFEHCTIGEISIDTSIVSDFKVNRVAISDMKITNSCVMGGYFLDITHGGRYTREQDRANVNVINTSFSKGQFISSMPTYINRSQFRTYKSVNVDGVDVGGIVLNSESALSSVVINNSDLAFYSRANMHSVYLNNVDTKVGSKAEDGNLVVDQAYIYGGSIQRGSRNNDIEFKNNIYLENVDMSGFDLQNIDLSGIILNSVDLGEEPCRKLKRAKNWKKSVRSHELACGDSFVSDKELQRLSIRIHSLVSPVSKHCKPLDFSDDVVRNMFDETGFK